MTTSTREELKTKPLPIANTKASILPQMKKDGAAGSTPKAAGSIKPSTTSTFKSASKSSALPSNPHTAVQSPSRVGSTSTAQRTSSQARDMNMSSLPKAGGAPKGPRGSKRKLAVAQASPRSTEPPSFPSDDRGNPRNVASSGIDMAEREDMEGLGAKTKGTISPAERMGDVTLDGEERAGKKVRLSEMDMGVIDLESGEDVGRSNMDEVPDSLEQVEKTGDDRISASSSGLGSTATTTVTGQTKSKPTYKSGSRPIHPNPPRTYAYHRLAPPKPIYPVVLPQNSASSSSTSLLKPGKPPQGSVPANNQSKPKNVILVSKNTGLGAYLRRCKKLLVDDGFATIHLHALSAAIPHSILILHSLLDILPFPKRCVAYELKSGSVKCYDEKKSRGGVIVKQQSSGGGKGWEWEPVLFDEQEDEQQDGAKEKTDGTQWEEKGDVRVRVVSSLEIIIRIGLDQKMKKPERHPGAPDPEVGKAEEALQKLREKTGTKPAGQGQASEPITSDTIMLDVRDDPTNPEEPTEPAPKVKKKNRPNRQQRLAKRRKAVLAIEAIGQGEGSELADGMTGASETLDVDMNDQGTAIS